MNYILAHDVGTSGSKGTLFNDRLEMVASQSVQYDVSFPKKGHAEQDPLHWWEAITQTTGALLEHTRIQGEDVTGIVFSAQMAGVLPIDDHGNALMNCLTWLDTRAAPQAKRIIGEGLLKISGYSVFPLIQFLRITGGSPGIAGKDAISKILWLKEETPQIYREAEKLLDVKDYLIYRCTGEYVTSRDCAHISWLMDSRPGRFRWSEPLLKKYGIDAAKLPQIKESTEVAGYLSRDVAQELQLPEGIPVMVGAGDMASAAVGSGAIHPGETHVYVGTSSWIGAHLPGRKKDLSHYMGSICSAQPDLYLCIAEQETASGCLEWIRNNVVREFSHDQLNEYVSTVEPGSGGVIFTPWLFGERSPLDDPQVRSGFYNLSLEHDRGHMARAVYEGVAVNIKWALTYFQDLVEKTAPLNCIHLIGGGALSDVWCQIFADAFARPVWRMHNPLGAGARGAAAIALVGLKQFRTFSDIHHLITVDTVFKPVPEHIPIYEDILQEFQRIYKKKVSTHKSY